MPEAIVNRNPFLTKHQSGFKRRPPNPNAFVALPEKLIESIGIYTHMGIRIDAAILSTFAYFAQKSVKSATMRVGGEDVEIPERHFALSVLKASENLWARWFHLPSDNDQFDRFYRRVQKAVGRLKASGHIAWASWLDGDDKRTRGSVWTFDGTPLEYLIGYLPKTEGQMVTVMRNAISEYAIADAGDHELTNIADLVGSAFVSENMAMFTSAEACYSVGTRGIYSDYLNWTEAVAKEGASGSRFVSVGATRTEDIGKDNPAAFLYWFILDIDRGHPLDAFDDTRECLYLLEEQGADLDEVVVSYTGGKGCHIRIPCGMFDSPVFRSVTEAQKVLTTLFEKILDGIEVDTKVFDPRQLIRIIGSKRETGAHAIYTRAFTGTEFVDTTFQKVVEESKHYEPATLVDPRTIQPVADLVMALVSASDLTRRKAFPKYNRAHEWVEEYSNGSVIQAALGKVTQGEEWHPVKQGQSYVGRNYAMFIAACHMAREFEGNLDVSFEALKTVNYNYTPPLPEREIMQCLRSAMRRVARDEGWGR